MSTTTGAKPLPVTCPSWCEGRHPRSIVPDDGRSRGHVCVDHAATIGRVTGVRDEGWGPGGALRVAVAVQEWADGPNGLEAPILLETERGVVRLSARQASRLAELLQTALATPVTEWVASA